MDAIGVQAALEIDFPGALGWDNVGVGARSEPGIMQADEVGNYGNEWNVDGEVSQNAQGDMIE